MSMPPDYPERVYAGVLGKIIGVYLGRPFEGWSYERIMANLGEIHYYVHDRLGVPLVVTDDDIAGTFTFLRALEDYDHDPHLSAGQIGQTWLNTIIEGRSILWWGGMGNSTEHTAYLRLKNGIKAPRSGSCALNGKIVSEQIGAQIFIDGWAMICPGDPERAADFARRAASVSHDGEAIYGAQIIAAMESLAFVESDLNTLIDAALSLIPGNSIIYRLINDVRNWHEQYSDWRQARQKIVTHYGYDTYGGVCHMVPNHALIHLGLLYGDDDFQKSLMITNTSGWDTDCNAANVGCLLGIKNGLKSIDEGPDWRGPVADRLFLAAADGGRCISDAVIEAGHVINMGKALAKEDPWHPKGGARFHFEFPGSLQGFHAQRDAEGHCVLALENTAGHSYTGKRSLALRYRGLEAGCVARAATPVFTLPEELHMPFYDLMASPTLYPGQTVRAAVQADEHNGVPVTCRLFISVYHAGDHLQRIFSPEIGLASGEQGELVWRVPHCDGDPLAEIGIEIAPTRAEGCLYLDSLAWDGTPEVVFKRPSHDGKMWRNAWVNAVDHFHDWAPDSFRIAQNSGRGLLIQGCREWDHYRTSADVTSFLMKAGGLAACVQGLQRFYALMVCEGGQLKLIKALDGDHVLAERDFSWQPGEKYPLSLEVDGGKEGTRIRAFCGDEKVFDLTDSTRPLSGGAVALVCQEGCFYTQAVSVSPLVLE